MTCAAAALAVATTSIAGAAHAQPADYRIDGGSLRDALATYARLTGRQLLYSSALVEGRAAPALIGRLAPDEALARLLAGTGLRARHVGNAFVIEAAPRRPASSARSRTRRATPARRRLRTEQPPAPREGEQQIVVTGSHIRGESDGPSPVQTIGRDDIDRAGYGSIAETIAALPQNFGGTGSEDTVLTSTDVSTLNIGIGSSANLRGLGSDATLTLVNGRRLPGSGGKGDFADLSLIPLAAVERVEVLADGASAIYGADAVGGVVNVILRRRIDGGETRLRLGGATQGGAQDLQFSHVQGLNWHTGSLIAAYEFERRGRLEATDRRYTRSADLRALGGNDFRNFFASPGTIVGPDPATGALVARFAIPAGTDGTGLVPADFLPGANLQTPYEGGDLLPRQTRHSAYLAARQEIAPGIELDAQGRYTRRRFTFDSAPSFSIVTVNASNPFFVSPDGAPTSLIAYWFGKELGPLRNFGTVQSWSASGGLVADLGAQWSLDLYGGYARESIRQGNDNLAQATYLAEAIGTLPDNPATPFSTARDGFFNPYGDGDDNGPAVLDFIDQGYLRQDIDSSLLSFDAKLDGPVARLAGGSVRAALGGAVRRETFLFSGESFVAGLTPLPIAAVGGRRTMEAAFAEIAVPLFGPANAVPGIVRLEFTAAARFEHYSDFGSAATPKLGIVWEPINGFRLRASYGTSFRTPALRELNQPVTIASGQLSDAQNVARSVIILTGGNPDLEPERARSLTAGIQLTPRRLSGLRAEANYFRIRFSNRIGTPVTENRALALRDPTLAPFITPISPGTNNADRDLVIDLSNRPGSIVSPLIPPELYTAVVDGRFVNTGSLFVQGIDLLVSQRFHLAGGQGSIAFNGTFLADYQRRATPAAAAVERVDTVGNPPDLRLRLSTTWDKGPFGLSAAVNHIGAYRDDLSVPMRQVNSWTTFDAQLRLRLDWAPWLAGTQVALSVQNLFDRDPPFVNRSTGQAYDASNADPIGRFVALQITRRW